MVRVLILIDQDVAEAPVVVLGDRRIVFEQSNRASNEVVEIQGVGLRKALFVFLIGRGDDPRNRVIRRSISVFLPGDELVLEVRNTRGHKLRSESFNIHVRRFQYHLNEALRILRIINTEGRSQTCCAIFRTQHSHARRVESRYPHSARRSPAHQSLDTLTHFGGSLIGESNRQNLTRASLARRQKVRDSMCEDASLPRARTGHDQQRYSAVLDCRTLLIVESRKQAFGVFLRRRGRCPRRAGAQGIAIAPEASAIGDGTPVSRRLRGWVVKGQVFLGIATEIEERTEIGK